MKWEDAIANYEKALSIYENDDISLNGLGIVLMAKGKTDEAIKKYLKAIQINPRLQYYDNIGDAYRSKGNFAEAVEFYEEILKMNKDDDLAHNGIGICFLSLKKLDDAIFHFSQAVKLVPQNFTYQANLGTAYTTKGDYIKATESYEEALRLKTDDYYSISRLADVKLRQKKFLEAANLYERAISLNPSPNFEDYSGLGDAYRSLREIDKAIESYQNALKINQNDDLSLNGIGLLLLSQNKYQEAAEKFQKAIVLHPEVFIYHFNSGVSHLGMGKLEEAAQSFKKAIEINPQDHKGYAGLGDCLAAKGLLTRAIEQYEIAIKIQPSPDYYSRIGNVYKRQKNWENAFTNLIKAVEFDPQNKENRWDLSMAYNARGLEYYQNKEYDKAIEDYKHALQWGISDVYYDNLYLAYLGKNNLEEAEKSLRKAIEINQKPEYYTSLNQLKTRPRTQ